MAIANKLAISLGLIILALPVVSQAQGRSGGMGGGPPAGVGAGSINGVGGGSINGVGGGMGSSRGTAGADMSTAGGVYEQRRIDALERKARAQARREAAAAKPADKTNANAGFGQTTATTARTLGTADQETRQAFGTDTAASAKLKRDGASSSTKHKSSADATRDTAAAKSAEKANANADLGQTTAAIARTLGTADQETRQAFGADTAASAKLKRDNAKSASTHASTQGSSSSTFGQDTSATAQTLGTADVNTRKQFGVDTSTEVKAKSKKEPKRKP